MSKKKKFESGLVTRDTIVHVKTKGGQHTTTLKAAPDEYILTANADVVLETWEKDYEKGVQKIESEFSAIVERSPIPQLDHLIRAVIMRGGDQVIGKIYERGFFLPLLGLYERIADLIEENVSSRKRLISADVKEGIQKNPDFFYGKLRGKFDAIVDDILVFEDEKKRNFGVFRKTAEQRDLLRKDFDKLNREAQVFLDHFRGVTFKIDYEIPQGTLTGEDLRVAKKIVKSLRKEVADFGALITRMKGLVPKATDINDTLELLFRFASDSEHKAIELTQQLQLWEQVFEPDINPYVAFECDMEVVYDALGVSECKEIALGSSPIELCVSEKYEERLRETREALNELRTRVNDSDYKQDPRLNDDEQRLQRLLVVAVYGITCLATRSQGRRESTFFRVLRELDHLNDEQEFLFQKVFDFSVRVENPLIVKNEVKTGSGYDVKQQKTVEFEYYLLTDLGKQMAKVWSNDLGDLAKNALGVARKFDRAFGEKKQKFAEYKARMLAEKNSEKNPLK